MYRTLEKMGLGSPREKVTLLPHYLEWARGYQLVASELLRALGKYKIDVYHIGSTAIPRIKAKPIIDILGVVDNIENFDEQRQRLERLGFEWKGEHGIRGRRYSVLYDPKKKNVYVHFHVFETGSPEIENHLSFRNFLNQNPEMAKQYERLKEELQTAHQQQRDAYSKSKEGFIRSVLAADCLASDCRRRMEDK